MTTTISVPNRDAMGSDPAALADAIIAGLNAAKNDVNTIQAGAGAANGTATLGASGRLPVAQLTSFYPATIAALIATANPGIPVIAQVQTTLAYYFFDPSSALTSDAFNIITPPTGSGRWIRSIEPHTKWQLQTSWYVDPVSGSDENDGAIATPIKTIKEWYRRTAGGFSGGTTSMFLVQATTWTGDLWAYSAVNMSGLNPGNGAETTGCTFKLFGTRTTVISGTVSAANDHNPAVADGACKVSSTSFANWTPYVGKLIVITSGANTGTTAFVDADLGSNQARVSKWKNGASLGTDTTGPSAADTFNVVDLLTFPIALNLPDTTTCFTCRDLQFQATAWEVRGSSVINFLTCIFPTSGNVATHNPNVNVDGCSIAARFASFSGIVSLQSSRITNEVRPRGTSNVYSFSNLFSTANATINLGVNLFDGGASEIFTTGFYNCATCIVVRQYAKAYIVSQIYGTGNTQVVNISYGGCCLIASSVTPVVTASTPIIFPDGTSQIPPLVAGSTVPAASTISTFAQWAASPFSRFVVTKDGSRLIST